MLKTIIVLGTQWGDEGKGKLVDYLTKKASAVIRFQGGHNAGHTVIIKGKQTILHIIPSGILHPKVMCFIGSGVVLSLEALTCELDMLQANGIFAEEQLKISSACPLILPYHIALDKGREVARGVDAIGTTGRGIGPAYEDKVARRAIRLGDLHNEKGFGEKLACVLDYQNFILSKYYNLPEIDYQTIFEQALAMRDRVLPMAVDVVSYIEQYYKQNKILLFEGAQGTWLDIDHGTYPFVTSSNTVAGAAAIGTGIGPCQFDYVLGVAKAYTTRVGAGAFPTELTNDIARFLRDKGHEFGATTGRPRRCGWFDAVALYRSKQINGLSALAVTKLDVLDGLEHVKICVAYEYKGERYTIPPVSDSKALAECRPVYETFAGWTQSTAGTGSLAQLPKNARAYLERIESLLELPIDMISVGSERDEIIVIRHPFVH